MIKIIGFIIKIYDWNHIFDLFAIIYLLLKDNSNY